MNQDLECDARYWRERAEQARQAAVEMVSPEAKATMLEIAAAYLRMVERAEDGISRWQHPENQRRTDGQD